MKRQVLFGTRSRGKQAEIRRMLHDFPYDIVFPDDIGLYEDPIEATLEVESTFEGNATRKAEYFQKRSRMATVAEDSGIEVRSLGGAPGVRSRRFALATENQDEANNAELLRRLAGAPAERRTAQYRCAVVFLADRNAAPQTFTGTCTGRILEEPRGTGGFGYDPLFYSDDLHMSFGEAQQEDKDAVSHRGRALRAFMSWLQDHPL
jgi:XTP/dITP diphosphohydrolase